MRSIAWEIAALMEHALELLCRRNFGVSTLGDFNLLFDMSTLICTPGLGNTVGGLP